MKNGVLLGFIPAGYNPADPVRLTKKTIKNAPAGERPYKLFDSGGLHLFITLRGGKHWRYDYRFDGQDCTLSWVYIQKSA